MFFNIYTGKMSSPEDLTTDKYDGCLEVFCLHRTVGVRCAEGLTELTQEMLTNPFDLPKEVK